MECGLIIGENQFSVFGLVLVLPGQKGNIPFSLTQPSTADACGYVYKAQ